MSRFIVSNGSYFQPFSYDELIKPVQQSAQAHAAAADYYDQLSMETEALKNYISTDGADDERARQMYSNYVTKLNTLRENLWANGYGVGTRRDLSAARDSYMSDIVRLQKAIQTRQERSKAYWDYKHEHPEAVTGFDPGLGGLDRYLDDDKYGQDWFSYNGNQLANEVASDIKARASSIAKSYIDKGLQVPGYLHMITERGIKNEDVNLGGELAKKVLYEGADIEGGDYTDTQRLVARVLVDRISGTGARINDNPNLTREEYDRLFKYGMYGASQAVMEPKDQMLNDKLFEHQLRLAEATHNSNLRRQEEKEKWDREHPQIMQDDFNYGLFSPVEGLSTPGAEKAIKAMSKEFERAYINEKGEPTPIQLKMPDGTYRTLNNWTEAMDTIYYNPIRRKIKEEMGGLDIGMDAQDFWGRDKSKQEFFLTDASGKTSKRVTGKLSNQDAKDLGLDPDNNFGIYFKNSKGELVVDKEATIRANSAKNKYDKFIKDLKDANPTINFKSIAMSPKQERNFLDGLKEKGVDTNGLSYKDYQTVANSRITKGEYTSPMFSSPTEDMDKVNENYARLIEDSYRKAAGKNPKNIGKTSFYAFYKEGKDHLSYDKKGVRNIGSVFTLDGDGNVVPKSLKSVFVRVEDILDSIRDEQGRLKVRITTNTGNWVIDSAMLSDQIYNLFNAPNAAGVSYSYLIDYLMEPITRPEKFMKMSDEEKDDWITIMYNTLGRQAPVHSSEGKAAPVTAGDVLYDNRVRNALRNSVTGYANAVLALPRDKMALENFRMRGNTSEHSQSYF